MGISISHAGMGHHRPKGVPIEHAMGEPCARCDLGPPTPAERLPMRPDPDAVEVAPATWLHHGVYLRGELEKVRLELVEDVEPDAIIKGIDAALDWVDAALDWVDAALDWVDAVLTCGSCGHPVHWRECVAVPRPVGCACRRRGPHSSAPHAAGGPILPGEEYTVGAGEEVYVLPAHSATPAPLDVPGAALPFTDHDLDGWRAQVADRKVDPALTWTDTDVIALVARFLATLDATRARHAALVAAARALLEDSYPPYGIDGDMERWYVLAATLDGEAATSAPLDGLREAALRVIEESILAPERDVVRVSIEAWRGLNAALGASLPDQPPVVGGTTAIRDGAYVTEERTPGPPEPSKCVFCAGYAVARVWDVGPVCDSWMRRPDHTKAALWAMAHGRIVENLDHPDWDRVFDWHRDDADADKCLAAFLAIEKEVSGG